jgi:hypothetical protein
MRVVAASVGLAVDDEIHDLLDARSPLLARAFRNSGTI